MRGLVQIVLLLCSLGLQAQTGFIIELGASHSQAVAFIDNSDISFKADENGLIRVDEVDPGKHVVAIFQEGFATKNLEMVASEQFPVYNHHLAPLKIELEAVEVSDQSRSASGMSRLKYIELDGLYAAKKNEIIIPDELVMNKANNNSRQAFAKVPGINIQETDAGGLQLGIGARGLDPKRTSNFNTRQNGYDISADALGYPESYYSPAMEAVEKIELVRGAASLQYGTQFGGLLNFKMKKGNESKVLEVVSRQTVGSYDFFSSFNSIGGSKNGWNYYAFFNHKEGRSWRPNSGFNANGAYVFVSKKLSDKWTVEAAYTNYFYNAKQPGGLTDRQFEISPELSFRDRNWFQVNWNIGNLTVNGQLSEKLSLNSKFFVLDGERAALGFLGNINRVDTGGARDLILGEFLNLGNETRLIQRFDVRGNPGAALLGLRTYKGDTRNRQGKSIGYDEPAFAFKNPGSLEGSDFRFPSTNVALFSEVLIPISACWFITPGARYEHIVTRNSGYYTDENRHPLTNELLYQEQVTDSSLKSRNLVLFGLGAVWRCKEDLEVYANASQNYRALNFSDVYVNNPNLYIDPNMKDENGFTIDFGSKGKFWKERITFDASAFMMHYENRIATAIVNPDDIDALSESNIVSPTINYRSNVSDALFIGLEVFEEVSLGRLFGFRYNRQMKWYNNVALVRARYVSTDQSAFKGNSVENVPTLNYRTGLSFEAKRFGLGIQYNYVSEQFTDATNASYFPDATVGLIPAYSVIDLSASYQWKRLKVESSISNLTDEIYFTRRATGYPGPGIIPAERRMFFLTLELRL